MQSLSDLKAGKLKGITRLTLCENLKTFPLEILELSDTLEILDLSNNLLCEVPAEISQLKKLKIAFFSNNKFTAVPSAFKDCENLYMLGFKANQIETFDEDILPLSISWLILTDNRLKALPHSIGKLEKLQKFPVAGNQLTELPQELSQCHNLELLRLSANQLTDIPNWLLELPKLSWLAFSGNPCSISTPKVLSEVAYDTLELKELLGEGASGQIYKGYDERTDKHVAIKLFKGAVTSDGYAQDEMNAYINAGDHPHLIKVLAKIKEDTPLGLIMEFIPPEYENLGFAPNFNTCTRDTFKEGINFDIQTIYSIAKAMVAVSSHLHKKALMHGDLYAHNILINKKDKHCYLGDFGAASFYDADNQRFEKVEIRAFGCLIEDLLQRCQHKESKEYQSMQELSQKCMHHDLNIRPLFSEILLP